MSDTDNKISSKSPKTSEMPETNDYESDMKFGQWIRDQRNQAGLSIKDASDRAEMTSSRLQSLELGYSDRGITRQESERLATVYKIALSDILERASD